MRCGLLGLDRAAGEDQLQGAAHADRARQPLRAAVDQRHAPAALEETEGRLGRGDAQVAPERQLDSAGEAPAVDRGDRRLGRGEAGRAHRPVRVVDVEVHRLQVGAGAEGLAAGAGEDEDAGALVGLEVGQALPERRRRRRVDRVAPLGPVDRQDRGGPDPLVAQLVGHGEESMGAGGLVAGKSRDSQATPTPRCAPVRGSTEAGTR